MTPEECEALAAGLVASGTQKRVRGEDGREVEFRSPSEIADAISICNDLSAARGGGRQNAIVVSPVRKPL